MIISSWDLFGLGVFCFIRYVTAHSIFNSCRIIYIFYFFLNGFDSVRLSRSLSSFWAVQLVGIRYTHHPLLSAPSVVMSLPSSVRVVICVLPSSTPNRSGLPIPLSFSKSPLSVSSTFAVPSRFPDAHCSARYLRSFPDAHCSARYLRSFPDAHCSLLISVLPLLWLLLALSLLVA